MFDPILDTIHMVVAVLILAQCEHFFLVKNFVCTGVIIQWHTVTTNTTCVLFWLCLLILRLCGIMSIYGSFIFKPFLALLGFCLVSRLPVLDLFRKRFLRLLHSSYALSKTDCNNGEFWPSHSGPFNLIILRSFRSSVNIRDLWRDLVKFIWLKNLSQCTEDRTKTKNNSTNFLTSGWAHGAC